jgi:hypothetical protein
LDSKDDHSEHGDQHEKADLSFIHRRSATGQHFGSISRADGKWQDGVAGERSA